MVQNAGDDFIDYDVYISNKMEPCDFVKETFSLIKLEMGEHCDASM